MIFILLQKRKNPTAVGAGDLGVSGIRPLCVLNMQRPLCHSVYVIWKHLPQQ